MLVLSRKVNETIIINDNIVIVVVDIRGDKVRLGIDAPKDVPVHRQEVYEAMRRDELKYSVPESKPIEPIVPIKPKEEQKIEEKKPKGKKPKK
ncbi:MAG: carbon storage regulator CsrA [Candidatus Staskawiczbacteria bacterium]|nr:carbon storage regulator CsrA [Candidatus Staskawiczbacteria bacterium]